MSHFYIVATPIGNLKDISKRALEVLKGVDLILCEDTRVTQKLLNRFNIKAKTLSYHQHSKLKKINYIISLLNQGKNLALVSDAGTPGISDPGNKLIETAIKQVKNLKIIPIPGTSALTAAVSICGFPMNKFLFLGFPPIKKKRRKFFEQVIDSKYPVVFYESPYRIIKSLSQLGATMKSRRDLRKANTKCAQKIMVARELTKNFETIYRGTIEEVIKKIERDAVRGEFVIVTWNPCA